jgi:hypothetical protein
MFLTPDKIKDFNDKGICIIPEKLGLNNYNYFVFRPYIDLHFFLPFYDSRICFDDELAELLGDMGLKSISIDIDQPWLHQVYRLDYEENNEG